MFEIIGGERVVRALIAVFGVLVFIGVALWRLYSRVEDIESDIRKMKPLVPIRPTQPIPEPPPMRRKPETRLKCAVWGCNCDYPESLVEPQAIKEEGV